VASYIIVGAVVGVVVVFLAMYAALAHND